MGSLKTYYTPPPPPPERVKGYLHHFYNVGYLHSPHNIIKENRYHFQIIQKQTTKTAIFFKEKQHSSSTRRHIFKCAASGCDVMTTTVKTKVLKTKTTKRSSMHKMIKKATLYVRYFYANTLLQKKVPPLSLRSVRVVKVHALFIFYKNQN